MRISKLPRNYYLGDIWADGITADEIIIVDREPRFTGLYDVNEKPIYHKEEKIKFGFCN